MTGQEQFKQKLPNQFKKEKSETRMNNPKQTTTTKQQAHNLEHVHINPKG